MYFGLNDWAFTFICCSAVGYNEGWHPLWRKKNNFQFQPLTELYQQTLREKSKEEREREKTRHNQSLIED